MAEEAEGVGQRRLVAAAAVAGGTRMGARTLWPDLEYMAEVHRGNAAAAGADGLDVDGVGPQRMARDLHLRLEQRSARQHRHVGARSAGIEGDEIVDALHVAEMAATDHAGHRPGHDGLDRRSSD